MIGCAIQRPDIPDGWTFHMPAPDDQLHTLRMSQILCLVLAVAVVSSIGLWIYTAYSLSRIASGAEYKAALQESIDRNKQVLMDETVDLAVQLGPPVGNALAEEFRERQDQLADQFAAQSVQLAAQVKEAAKDAVRSRLDEMLAREKRVLAEAFPGQATENELADVMTRFQALRERLSERYHVGELTTEMARTVELWQSFEPVPPPGPDDEPLASQLVDYLANWSMAAVSERIQQRWEKDNG